MSQSATAPRVELSDRRQSPLTFYLMLLLFSLVSVLLRAVMLSPLAALFIFEKGSPLCYLALLTPAALLFVDVPLRMSFADALVQSKGERFFSFDRALSLRPYGEKLSEGMRHVLSMLKWAVPLLVCGGVLAYFYLKVDVLTLMNGLTDFGKAMTGAYCAVVNFFGRLFGGAGDLAVNAGMFEGVYAILAIVGLCVVIFLFGALRNSAYRYIWALASREDRSAAVEARRRLRGRRWAQLLVGLLNLLLWLPALYVVATTLKGVIGDASQMVMNLLAGKGLDKTLLYGAAGNLALALFGMYLPLLPIRRILTAVFATHNVQRTLPAQPIVTTPAAVVPQEPVVEAEGEPNPSLTLPNE